MHLETRHLACGLAATREINLVEYETNKYPYHIFFWLALCEKKQSPTFASLQKRGTKQLTPKTERIPD